MLFRSFNDRFAGLSLRRHTWSLVCLAAFCGSALAAPPGGGLDVTVRDAVSHDRLHGVYVGLIATDDPAHRPTKEAIVDGAIQWSGIAAGRYVLMTEAPSFGPAMRNIEIGDATNGQATVDLQREVEISGSVVDATGQPVKGATISDPRISPPMPLGVLSDLARQNATRLRTTTDENGRWSFAMPLGGIPLLVEAPGYEAAWVVRDTTPDHPPIALHAGSSLRIVTNRPAPDVALTLVPSSPKLQTSVPAVWRSRVWARAAETTAVEWTSMPAGEYDLVASWPDPRRYAAPVTLRHVTLDGNGGEPIHVSLPDAPPIRAKNIRVAVPLKTQVRGLRAFQRTPDGGVSEVAAAPEYSVNGPVLYANADPAADVFFTTDGEVVLGGRRVAMAGAPEPPPAIEGIKFPKADGTLRVSVPELAPFPAHGNARFDGCDDEKSFALPVNVQKSGDVALPLLVGCRVLTLRFENYSPVVVRTQARPREQVWLGTHHLTAAASAQIHVTHKSDGSSAPDAMVTALVPRGPGEPLPVAKAIAHADGWTTIEGLPAGEEITFRAEDATRLAGTIARTLEPGKREIIDPLALPEAGTLTVTPRFDDTFHNENPASEITEVTLQPVDKTGNTDLRIVALPADQHEAVFAGLMPVTWKVGAVVTLGELKQQLDLTTVEIAPGDKKTIEPVIEPLVIAGHLLSHDHGVAASIAFTDPPGPGATTRRVMSGEDGSFKTLLPRPGYYAISARRTLPEPDSQLQPMRFDHAQRDLRIELPEGSLAVHVVSGEQSQPEVQVTASLLGDSTEPNQIVRFERRERTDPTGDATFGDLQDGKWLIRARGKDDSVAEKVVTIASATPASVTLNLEGGAALEGAVLDSAGNPAGAATVNCMYAGSDRIPRTGAADTDSWGKFSIRFPKPAPERLQCSVAAADGAIATFTTAPASNVNWTLPSASGSLTLTNWTDRGNRDRFWLVAPDGGLFDLSLAAFKQRRLDGPLTLPRVPVGAWSIVRVDSAGAYSMLAGGGAGELPRVAQVSIAAGQHKELSMTNGVTSASR